ncbi:DNA internalization-related competence protein ComEC/Rec2 [Gracilibacillus sp. YIM 98692]|uniref:DNA internalization-related competence protein ComEC/Rec2 n=1 Tax=Gracilibacillus sp. YIM 98692 TaxID=2663532 RepID=UPI0013D42B50|nr:DNA internalization-related competence protein ComEC/Rec2 [Gracilibacillus sp. YIM 98692]
MGIFLHWYVIVLVIVIMIPSAYHVLAFLLLLFLLVYGRWRWNVSAFFICSIMVCFVISSNAFSNINRFNESSDLTEKTVLHGKIASEVTYESNLITFHFLETSTKQKLSIISFYDDKKDMEEWRQSFKTGSTCRLSGAFQPISSQRNPGQFNFQQYLADQGISKQFELSQDKEQYCQGSSMEQFIYDLRNSLKSQVKEKVDPLTFAWFNALMLGDREALSDDTVRLFQKWNLSHLLAISGLHVGLIITYFYLMFVYIFRLTIDKVTVWLCFFLPIYPLLAGSAPSVWRASILAFIILLLQRFRIQIPFIQTLSIVFLLLVCMDPYIVYSLAFQFSFIVTYAIVLSKKILIAKEHTFWGMLDISLISLLVILPIQLQQFYEFQPLSILVNVLVIPYFTFFVLPFFLFLLFVLALPFLVPLLDRLFVFVHTEMLNVLIYIDQFFGDSWVIGYISFVSLLLYYFLCILFMIFFEKNDKRKAFIIGGILVCFLICMKLSPYINPYGSITMLDIGQGDAIIIELPYRKGVYMIDAGGTMTNDYSESSDRNFKQIIEPYLKYRGIDQLDALVLTHADHDHVGSVPYLLTHIPVNYLITSPYFNKELVNRYKEISPHLIHQKVQAKEYMELGGHPFLILHPDKKEENANENSLVLHSEFGGLSFLFTGDLGAENEEGLEYLFSDSKVDILKVAHHGSNTSTSDIFLDKINPQFAFISVGKDNRYGHPHHEVISRLEDRNVYIFRTDQHGAITYKFTKRSGTISTFLPYDKVN